MRFRLELPKGSLNDPTRTDTNQVLVDAFLGPIGYTPKDEDENRMQLTAVSEAKLFLGRPQSMARHLADQHIDAAVCGDDWISNCTISSSNSSIKKVGDIGYGNTRLVLAVKKAYGVGNLDDFLSLRIEEKKPIKCYTELVHLVRYAFINNATYRNKFGQQSPAFEFHGSNIKGNDLVKVVYSDGHTEAEMRKGADIVADITETGATLKKYDLVEIQEIARSSVGLYTGPSCTGYRKQLAHDLYQAMHNVIEGRTRIHAFFNIPENKVYDATDFLVEKGWCSANPTIVRDDDMARIDTVVPKDAYFNMERALRSKFGASGFIPKPISNFGK